MTIKTDLSKKQLATILSALDDARRNPANKGEALRAIGRSAAKLGLTTENVLAAAPGLLDERLTPAEFRAELADAGGQETSTEAAEGASEAETAATSAEAGAAANTPAPTAEGDDGGAPAADDAEAAARETPAKPTPRPGTKQAQMIDLMKRPEGATIEQIAEVTGWQHHTIRGAISGALKKKLGLTVEAIRIREVGPNKTGAKGSATVYRIVESAPEPEGG
jgi:hypothetical protein